jgi:hypothetical protein
LFLNKNWTMDNVQKTNNGINMPSSQTFRSYQNNRLDWIHHVQRIEIERIPNQLMDFTPRETRSIGRPKLNWKDQPLLHRNGLEG